MSRSEQSAQMATKTNAARQLTMPASSVPKGTPMVLASVCPKTMTATARPSWPLSAMGAGGDGGGAKEGAVRHARDEARHGEHAGAGGESGHGVAREAQQHEGHKQALGGNAVAKHQDEGAKADANGVGGDEAAGLGHCDAHARGDVGDDAHEHELRKAQGKRARGKRD